MNTAEHFLNKAGEIVAHNLCLPRGGRPDEIVVKLDGISESELAKLAEIIGVHPAGQFNIQEDPSLRLVFTFTHP
jgi:hypothetical protein